MNSTVAIVKCTDYDSAAVYSAVKKAIDLSGGIEKFVKPESKVLLKPNLLMAKSPEYGITTHPEVVRAVARILKAINCRLYLGDGPSVWGNQIEDVDKVYEETGMARLCREEGIELVKFDKKKWKGLIPLTSWLDECDYLVNIPKFKTHGFTLISAGVKNLFGLVPGTYKTELHKNHFAPEDFSGMLVEIYEKSRPCLTVVDGILALEGDGPATSAKKRDLGLVLASADCIALDSAIALIMGIDPKEVPTNRIGALRGLGAIDTKFISFTGEKPQDLSVQKFILPVVFNPGALKSIWGALKKFIRYYPVCLHNACIKCFACIKACPNKCISAEKGRINFSYRKCIACFCCQEVCPRAAIKIKKSILARLIGL